jgi:transposase InsO family protein
MCRVLSVSRSGYYRWINLKPSKRTIENDKILSLIRIIHSKSDKIYGSPKITAELRNMGLICNHKRVERLMRLNGIYSKVKKKFKVTTHSKHKYPIADNLLNRDFTASKLNRVWTSDITYIWTREGWMYLSVFMDLFNRKIVGWSMKKRLKDDLVTDAFRMAASTRKPPPGLIVHSDRGIQYCSKNFKELLNKYECLQSMSSTGDCYDNAVTESFFHILKTELVYHRKYESRHQARKSIFKYIEMFYNRVRIHSYLGGMSPHEYELKMAA